MPGCTIDKWGPATWNALHCFAHSAPKVLNDSEQARFRLMLDLVGEHLPCPTCRRHFKEYLEEHYVNAMTREDLVEFLNDMHNSVNVRLGKRAFTLEEHYRAYRPKRRRIPSSTVSETLMILLLAAVILRASGKKTLFFNVNE